jgi:hypothetical protein
MGISNFNSCDIEDYICGTVNKGIIIQGQLVYNTGEKTYRK